MGCKSKKYLHIRDWNYWWDYYRCGKDREPFHGAEFSLTEDETGEEPFFHFDFYNLPALRQTIRDGEFVEPDSPDHPHFLEQARRLRSGEQDWFVGALYYPLEINLDDGEMYDGDADDNYSLFPFTDVWEYTDKKYGVHLEWNYYTEGRAKQLIEYLKNALQNADSVELWRVWLGVSDEFEDSPVIHRQTISVDELTVKHIEEIDHADVWNTPDKMYPNRPSFYCLEIR